jgi:hypothetical protein
VISLLSLSGILGLPDTPRWYYDQRKGEQGDRILARLHDLPIDDEKVQSQKDEILSIISLEHRETSKFQITTLFWDNTELRFGRRLRVVFLLQMFQQLMGEPLAPGIIKDVIDFKKRSIYLCITARSFSTTLDYPYSCLNS